MDWKTKKVDKYVVINKVLGKGTYGTVFRGYYLKDSKLTVAAKVIQTQVGIDHSIF